MIALPSPISRTDDLICCDLPELEFSRTYCVWEAWKLRLDILRLPLPHGHRARLLCELNAELNDFESEVMARINREEEVRQTGFAFIVLLAIASVVLFFLWVG